MRRMRTEEIREAVRSRSGRLAETGGHKEPWCPGKMQAGDAVVDFGCGGGIDVILAAHKVKWSESIPPIR